MASATFTHPSAANQFAVQVRPSRQGKEDSLLNYIRGLAQDNARIRVENANVTDLTDSTTATAATDTVVMTIPTSAFDGQSSGASPGAAFNTAAGIFEDIGSEFAQWVNGLLARLGLRQLTWAAGSGTSGTLEAAAGAVAGLTATNGATAIDSVTGLTAMSEIRNNIATMLRSVNEIAAALGDPTLTDSPTRGTPSATYVLVDVTTAATGTGDSAGETSISDTIMDAFLAASINNVATIAAKFNSMIMGAQLPADIADNSGGASDGDTLATAGSAFTGHTDGGGNDSSPKAAFDTEMPKLEKNFADLGVFINVLSARYNLALLTNSTTESGDGTLEVIDDSLTAVGASGTASLPVSGFATLRAKIDANVATCVTAVNLLVPFFGIIVITDNFGGVTSATSPPTLVEIGTSGSAVDNSSDPLGLADSDIDGYLDRVTDAFKTITDKLDEMTGSAPDITKPLKVVAGLT